MFEPLAKPMLTACLLMITGCAGYQVGPSALFRADIQTVYVPVFESDSYRPHLGEQLTEAVIREIQMRTPYRVVHRPDADSVLYGRIVDERKRVVAENRNDEPRDIATSLTVRVSWHDRRGTYLMQDASFVLEPISFVAAQQANFIPESGQSLATAHQEGIERLARQIVGQMEAPW